MYESLRTVRAVEQAFRDHRYVYFRATKPWTGRWIRIGNKGRWFIRGLRAFGEFRARA